MRAHLTFLLAAFALVLHLLDDAFLRPEPGTSARDHLTVLIPIALVVAAAIGYARARPGVQASIALVLGVVALTYAGVSVAEAAGAGLKGHDYTGLLLLPGGLALFVLAGRALWRSRRGSGTRRRRYLRRALLAATGVVLVAEVVYPLALAIVVTHRPREQVEEADLGRPHERVTIRTSDGLDLAAWYVRSRNRAAVIAFPGRDGPLDHARMLIRHGYGVLLLDMRGRGESDGDPNMLGWSSPKDLAAAVGYLDSRPDVDPERIGGLGLSVGGEQMIQAAAENRTLRAVVAEGAGIRSLREHLLLTGPEKWLTLPATAVWTGTITLLTGDLPPPSLGDIAARVSPRSLFLIYAAPGQGGESLNPAYFARAREPKQLWKVPGAGHTGGLDARPDEYERRVITFFENALLDGT